LSIETSAAAPRVRVTGRAFIALLALYFAAQLCGRLLLSDGLHYDEAEQALLVDSFAWGYNAQPPLYTWLEMPWVALLGMSPAAFLVPKFLLICALYVAIYAVARKALADERAAIAAALSLFLFPEIGWEWLRARTHLILVSIACAVTLLALLRLRERRDARGYALLGVCFGFGMLAKYNYVMFAASVFAAALTVPGLRAVVLDRRMALALAVGALVVAPHAAWVVSELPAIRAAVHSKFVGVAPSPSVVNAAVNTLFVFLPVVLVFFAIARGRLVAALRESWRRDDLVRFLACYFAIAFALFVVGAALVNAAHFQTRWAAPMFMFVPILFLRALDTRADRVLVRRVSVTGAAVALAIGVAFQTFLVAGAAMGRAPRLNAPFPALAAALPSTRADILAEDHYVGGNLRVWLDGVRVYTPQLGLRPERLEPGTLLVWDATRNPQPPADLLQLARSLGVPAEGKVPAFVERPYARAPRQIMRLGVIVL
jgi:4-amino-4-deoxy-L-arabinose transferase-like glycosyltransferase